MNKKIVFGICLYLLSGLIQAEKILELDMVIPGFPQFSQNRSHYVFASPKDGKIYLYDRKTLQQTGQFGKIGEGPEEFVGRIYKILVNDDQVIVVSRFRLSVYDLGGRLVSERPIPHVYQILGLSGRNLIAQKQNFSQNSPTTTLLFMLLDPDFKELKTFTQFEPPIGPGSEVRMEPFMAFPMVLGSPGHIVLADARGEGTIKVYDSMGQQTAVIRYPFPKIPVSDEDEKEVTQKNWEWINKDPFMKKKKDQITIIIPPHYPPFSIVQVDDDRILASMYGRNPDGSRTTLCFSLRGKFQGAIRTAKGEWGTPYQGFFYRIIENEETENFELHRWPIGKPQK